MLPLLLTSLTSSIIPSPLFPTTPEPEREREYRKIYSSTSRHWGEMSIFFKYISIYFISSTGQETDNKRVEKKRKESRSSICAQYYREGAIKEREIDGGSVFYERTAEEK